MMVMDANQMARLSESTLKLCITPVHGCVHHRITPATVFLPWGWTLQSYVCTVYLQLQIVYIYSR